MHILVIGAGSIGKRHVHNFLRLDGVRISIAEPSEVVRDAIQTEYPIEAAYADYRDADLSSFDGAIVCVPSNLHVPMTSKIIAAGTHVLCEKPLSTSTDGIAELKKLRDQMGVVVAIAFVMRITPVAKVLKAEIGRIGHVHLVRLAAGQNWPKMRVGFPPAYAIRRETGGGCIPDHLVHQINLFEWLFGPTQEVSAHHWHRELPGIETEDLGVVTMQFANKTVANLTICMCQQDAFLDIHFAGKDGSIKLDMIKNAMSNYDEATNTWNPCDLIDADRDDWFRDQAANFIGCIKGEQTPNCTIEEAEQTLHTVLTALESADSNGRSLPVPQV